jgi:N-acetylmuramoyl-L-alanine amidase
VPPDRVAHHVRGFNERSIGFELDNPGRYPDWFNSRRQQMTEPYTRPQLENLLRLVQVLRTSIPSIRLVSGHEMLDRERIPASDRPEITIRRKVDPGPLFPWDRFLAASGLEFIKAGKRRFEIVSGDPVR